MCRKLFFCLVVAMLAVGAMSLQAKADYSSVVQGDTPVAFYEFEDTNSANGATCADTMGNHTAYYQNTSTTGLSDITLGAGLIGNAATFYGDSGGGKGNAVHISGGNASGLELQTMSVEFLVNAPYAANTYQRLYSHADGNPGTSDVSGMYGDARQIAVQGPNSTWYTNFASGPVFDEAWHYVAVTMSYDSDANETTMSWYYDGGLVGNTTQPGAYDYSGLASWSDPMIGANGNPGYVYNNFIGTLDEVAIYDYALSDTQVAAHFAAIPEPTTIALLGLGSLALIRRKK